MGGRSERPCNFRATSHIVQKFCVQVEALTVTCDAVLHPRGSRKGVGEVAALPECGPARISPAPSASELLCGWLGQVVSVGLLIVLLGPVHTVSTCRDDPPCRAFWLRGCS